MTQITTSEDFFESEKQSNEGEDQNSIIFSLNVDFDECRQLEDAKELTEIVDKN